jgi:alpha/beta superfamily hydrolase
LKQLKFPGRKRLLRWLIVILIGVFVVINIIFPIAFGYFATTSAHTTVGPAPDGFQVITLKTSDDVELAGWYAPPENGAVILLLHGAGNSRDNVRSYTAMLVKNGFGVLAFDLRGHGESDGRANRLGWNGMKDVGAAVDYLSNQGNVQTVGGLGLSLGGEVLLGAVSTYPELKAVVSEGASYRSFEEFRALSSVRNVFRSTPPWIMYTSVRLFSGDTPPTPPILKSITEADTTRLLLIAAGDEGKEIEYNTLFSSEVGDRAELWIVLDVGHTGAYARDPEEYERRVIAFFNETLLGE